MELYLFRHGESEMNIRSGLITGRMNEVPLSDDGAIQALMLGEYLKCRNIIPDIVYVSPALRTVQTARITLDHMGLSNLDLVGDPRLQEMDQGEWSGRSRKEVYVESVLNDMKLKDKHFKAPSGESMHEVGERMFDFISGLNNTDRVFIFSHSMAIKCLAGFIRGSNREEIYTSKVDNVSATLLLKENNSLKLVYLGKDFVDIARL
ncbi:MAG: histidine phosphatase family protein [Patescibacteria group bacterium]